MKGKDRRAATERPATYRPLIALGDIRRALLAASKLAPNDPDIQTGLAALDLPYAPGDLVEYQDAKRRWKQGVVVALMVHRPLYICGPGDDREAKMPRGMLGCHEEHVRLRPQKAP